MMETDGAARSAMHRRRFLQVAAAAGAGAMLYPRRSAADTAPRSTGAPTVPLQEMARYPEKTDLILLTDRPPQLETPIRYFREDFTPNEAFFVRWHLALVPTSVDLETFTLELGGHVEQPLSLTLDDLKKEFEPFSIVAVNQCSGNSRGLFSPRVPGGQWGNGAVGNAKWTGVRLRDLLNKAKPKAGAREVSFQGLDKPPQPSVPLFIKSLDYTRAADGEVMVAYEMNGKPLPMLNGFPLRLVVPGWYATYWVKALNEINVLAEPFHGFWMDKAYRVPETPDAQESPQNLAAKTVPITKMTVRSIFVRPEPGEAVRAGQAYAVEGLAMDGGDGIKRVEVSTDGGKTWADAKLDASLGKYSWRRFRFAWTPSARGRAQLLARATNAAGETQTTRQWNRSGYARNVIDPLDVTVI